MTKKKSKHFYSLLLNKKAQLPNMARKLQNDFNFMSDQLQQMVNLPHQVALEPYVNGFQYKVLNFILCTTSTTSTTTLQVLQVYFLQIGVRNIVSFVVQLPPLADFLE